MAANLYRPGIVLSLVMLSACSTVPPCPPPTQGDLVYVIEEGWHAGIGIPVALLGKQLEFYRKIFPEARVITFGYGKKTFFTAPAESLDEYLLGPFPGPAAIQVVGLRVSPLNAYPGDTIVLALPPGGKEALASFIWNDLAKDVTGKPYVVAPSTEPDGLFYQAVSEYTTFHTCNTWTADALHAAGLPVSGGGVIFSGQAMSRIQEAAAGQCPALR